MGERVAAAETVLLQKAVPGDFIVLCACFWPIVGFVAMRRDTVCNSNIQIFQPLTYIRMHKSNGTILCHSPHFCAICLGALDAGQVPAVDRRLCDAHGCLLQGVEYIHILTVPYLPALTTTIDKATICAAVRCQELHNFIFTYLFFW